MQQQNIWHIAKYQDNKNNPKICANGQILQTFIFTFLLGIYNLKPWPYLQIPFRNALTLKVVAAFRTVVFSLGLVCFFSRNCKSIIQKYSYLLLYFIFLMELLFVVATIIGSPGKNVSLLFHSEFF